MIVPSRRPSPEGRVSSRARLGLVTLLAAAAGSSAIAAPARAQVSIPSITVPKQAAMRAAAAANAQTAAMQNPDAAMPSIASSSAPTAIQAAAAPAHAQARQVSGPAPRHPAPRIVAAAAPAAGSAKAGTGKPGPAGGPAGGPADTGMTSISVTARGTKGEVSLNREVFSYDPGARRDPFISLMRNGDLRPLLADLRLVTVLYDVTGQNSIAVMRDQSTKDQYRVRVGQTLGRMRVAQIQPKQVVFTIEEVGFSRQETLALGDSTKARTQ